MTPDVKAATPEMSENKVKIVALGDVGCGKSAVLGEIEIALKAIGLNVQWADPQAARQEKNLTHADWALELERTQPTVWLAEIGPGPVIGADIPMSDKELEVSELAAKFMLKASPSFTTAHSTLRTIDDWTLGKLFGADIITGYVDNRRITAMWVGWCQGRIWITRGSKAAEEVLVLGRPAFEALHL